MLPGTSISLYSECVARAASLMIVMQRAVSDLARPGSSSTHGGLQPSRGAYAPDLGTTSDPSLHGGREDGLHMKRGELMKTEARGLCAEVQEAKLVSLIGMSRRVLRDGWLQLGGLRACLKVVSAAPSSALPGGLRAWWRTGEQLQSR